MTGLEVLPADIIYLLRARTGIFDDQYASASGTCIAVWIFSVLRFFKRGRKTLSQFFFCSGMFVIMAGQCDVCT